MHTPGPWTIQHIPSHGLELWARVDIGKEDMSNGELQPIYGVDLKPSLMVDDNGTVTMMISYESWRQFPSINFKKMQQANGHLITAAPELLEACKDALSAIETLDVDALGRHSEIGYSFRDELADKLQAAIVKATDVLQEHSD